MICDVTLCARASFPPCCLPPLPGPEIFTLRLLSRGGVVERSQSARVDETERDYHSVGRFAVVEGVRIEVENFFPIFHNSGGNSMYCSHTSIKFYEALKCVGNRHSQMNEIVAAK